MTQQAWLPTKQMCSRSMETWLATSSVHAFSWRLQSQIRRKGICTASLGGFGRQLRSNYRMGWKTVHRYHPGLGLQAQTSPPLNAKLCQEGSHPIPTCYGNKTTTCTIAKHSNSIQSQEAICYASFHSSTFEWKRKEVHPKGMRQISLPWKSSRHHISLSNQRHCFIIRQSDRRHHKTNKPAHWFHCNTRRSSLNIQRKRHEPCSPQCCQLPQQTESKKLSRGAFFPIRLLRHSTQQWRHPQYFPYY